MSNAAGLGKSQPVLQERPTRNDTALEQQAEGRLGKQSFHRTLQQTYILKSEQGREGILQHGRSLLICS